MVGGGVMGWWNDGMMRWWNDMMMKWKQVFFMFCCIGPPRMPTRKRGRQRGRKRGRKRGREGGERLFLCVLVRMLVFDRRLVLHGLCGVATPRRYAAHECAKPTQHMSEPLRSTAREKSE